jgi:glycosyltransferase involved in cell wall biosynthesis
MPVVSVLMAFHRVTPFLRPAVRSVLDQTARDLELILTDNGTGAGLAPLGEDGRDPRIRLISHSSNLGIAAAHNAAVAVAGGEFVALLDYDDLALPQRLEKQVAALRAGADTGLVSCDAESIDENGRVFGREFSLGAGPDQLRYSLYAAPVVTPAYTGRREVFERFPYRTEFACGADFDFLARAAERYPFGAVPEVLLQYRHHAGQTTVEQSTRIARERCVVRLLAARRRAGRDEGAGWSGLLQAAAGETDRAGMLRDFARQCLAEDFPVLAAYHARRSLAEVRTVGNFFAAVRLLVKIRRRAGVERGRATRMFWRGPVKALGVASL